MTSTATADVGDAAALAAHELLGGNCDEVALVAIAVDLKAMRLSYSTHDLAASIALSVLKCVSPPNRRDALARMTVLEWYREGKVTADVLRAFENPPYNLDEPSSP